MNSFTKRINSGTGDNTNFALWGSAIALPMIIAALAAVEIRRRKRRMAVEGKEN